MWKKVISLFLVICLLTTVVGCGGGGVTPPINDDNDDNDYSEISEEFIEEEKTFMVNAEEGGIFELSDRSRVEISPDSLSRDATLYIAKINLEPQDTSNFNSEIIYEVKIIERTVNILQPFKLFLPIPLGIDTSNIAVLRFDEDNNYEFINGTIGLKSIDNFIGIETEKSGAFTVTASDSDEDGTLYQDVAEIVDFFLEAKEYYTAGVNDWISSQYQQAKNEEQDALYRLEYTTPGLDWDKDGDEITMQIAESATLGMMGLIAGSFPELVVTKIIAIASLVSAVGSTLYILKVYCKSIPAQYAIKSYYITQLKLKAVSFFYEKIFLNISYIDARPPRGPAPHDVEIQGCVSSDSGTKPYTFQWAFGDGNWSEKIQVNDGVCSFVYHTYEEPDTYKPVLYVEDANGKKGQAEGVEIIVDPPDPVIPDKVLERIEVLPSSMTIKEGSSRSISSIKAYYSDDSTKSVSLNDPGLFYSNISPFIATVDDGKISGVKEGTVTIRVFYNDGKNVYDDVEVTVIPDKVLEKIEVLPSSMTIKKGSSQSISSIKAYYSDNTSKSVSLSDSALTYESLNRSVATVSYGKITAIKSGTATIRVYYSDRGVVNDKVAVTVPPPTTKVLERISVYPASMSLGQGEYQYISSIKAYYSNNTSANIFLGNPNLDYDSLNLGVADVDDNGKVTAIKPGSATIKVSYTDGVKVNDTVAVTVEGVIDPPEWVDATIGASIWIYICWDSVNGATHYQLYRATSETGTKTILSDWQIDTSFTDYDVNEGINYYYFVKAATSSTGANASTYSSYYIGFTIPPAPTGVSASQGTYMNSVSITWNSASLATHYQLYRATSETGTKTAISDWQTGTSFTDDNVIQGTTYYYFVKAAYYDSGSYYDSTYSSYAIGYPKPGDGTLLAPTGVTASNGTYTDKVYIAWNEVTEATAYRVYRATSLTGTKTALTGFQTNLYYYDYDITVGTHYYYFVRAKDSSGNYTSDYSEYNEGWASQVNHAPIITSAPVTTATFEEPYSYDVQTSDSDGDTLTYYLTTKPSGMTINSSTGLITWTPDFIDNYNITVKVSDNGTPVLSDTQSYVIVVDSGSPPPPSAPTGVSASDGTYDQKIRITWNTVPGATHYSVVRSTSIGGSKMSVSGWTTNTYLDDSYLITACTNYYYWVSASTSSTGDSASGYGDYDTGWRKFQVPVLSASDGIYSDHVKVTWDTNDNTSGYYRVYRATSPGGTKTALGSWQTGTTYNDYNVETGTVYYYWVQASSSSSGDCASDYSNYDVGYPEAEAEPEPEPEPLDPPTGVSASDGTEGLYAYITWNSVSGATHYRVYRATSSGGTKTAITSWRPYTDYGDFSAAPNVIYYYWVKAATSSTGDDASDYSNYDAGYSYRNEEEAIMDVINGFYQAVSDKDWNEARSYCIYESEPYEFVNAIEDEFYEGVLYYGDSFDFNISVDNISAITRTGENWEYANAYVCVTITTSIDSEVIYENSDCVTHYLQKVNIDWKLCGDW